MHRTFITCTCTDSPLVSSVVVLGVILGLGGRLGPFLVVLGGRLGSFLVVWGVILALLGASWGHLGVSWGVLGRSWGALTVPTPLEAILRVESVRF